MRPVLTGDMAAAARALLPLPPQARAGMARRLIAEAEAADRYRQRYKKAHGLWGDGTLMAAALMHPVGREPRLDDRAYLECQMLVIQALLAHRATALCGAWSAKRGFLGPAHRA